MTKKSSTGLFFEKRAQASDGRFFDRLPGRDVGNFFDKESQAVQANVGGNPDPSKTESINAGRTGGATGGQGFRGGMMSGEGQSGGMYGTGEGVKKEAEGAQAQAQPQTAGSISELAGQADAIESQTLQQTLMAGQQRAALLGQVQQRAGEEMMEEQAKQQELQARLQAMAGAAGPGGPSDQELGKAAGATPNMWGSENLLSDGFHRPASEQPEALEDGGERFFDQSASTDNIGVGRLNRHDSISTATTDTHQVGKHASVQTSVPRFLGTSYGIEKQAASKEDVADNYKASLKRIGGNIKRSAGETVEKASKDPRAVAAATGLLGLLAFKGGRGLLRGTKKAVHGYRYPHLANQKPKGMIERISQGAKGLIKKVSE
jgi:hypothetical protein